MKIKNDDKYDIHHEIQILNTKSTLKFKFKRQKNLLKWKLYSRTITQSAYL